MRRDRRTIIRTDILVNISSIWSHFLRNRTANIRLCFRSFFLCFNYNSNLGDESTVIIMSVCLSVCFCLWVCSHGSKTTCPKFTKVCLHVNTAKQCGVSKTKTRQAPIKSLLLDGGLFRIAVKSWINTGWKVTVVTIDSWETAQIRPDDHHIGTHAITSSYINEIIIT